MTLPNLSTIAITAYLIATPASAAEFTHRPQADGADVIKIDGAIEPGDDKKFIEIARDITQASVLLNSRGGHIASAISIGDFIRSRNYETRVRKDAVCNSACTLIWLAGTFRHLDRRSRLGFHSAATTRRPPYKRHELGNTIMAAYMRSMGVPQQVIDLQPKADPCCFNYIDHAQAKAWGLLSERPAKQQALRTPETQQPAATASALPKLMPAEPVPRAHAPLTVQSHLDQSPAYTVPSPPAAAASSKPPVRHGWMIQVGAYLNEQAAKERLSLVQSKASLMLTGAEAFTDSIEKGGTTLYRARFAGLDKDQAEWACAYLKLNDVECVIVKSQERIEPESRQAPATSAWPGAGDPGLPRWLMDEPRTKVRRTR